MLKVYVTYTIFIHASDIFNIRIPMYIPIFISLPPIHTHILTFKEIKIAQPALKICKHTVLPLSHVQQILLHSYHCSPFSFAPVDLSPHPAAAHSPSQPPNPLSPSLNPRASLQMLLPHILLLHPTSLPSLQHPPAQIFRHWGNKGTSLLILCPVAEACLW